MEQAPEPVEPAADTEAVEAEQPEQRTDDDAAKWKSLARKHETQAKALAKRLEEMETAQMSDLERAQREAQVAAEREAEAAARAEQAELRALRIEVASAKGLTPAQAKRLVGSTREELEADADEIVADFGARPQVTPQSTGAGAVSQERDSDDPNTWLRRAVSGVERRP